MTTKATRRSIPASFPPLVQAAQFAALPPNERKMQRRLIRNRLSAQLHRERQVRPPVPAFAQFQKRLQNLARNVRASQPALRNTSAYLSTATDVLVRLISLHIPCPIIPSLQRSHVQRLEIQVAELSFLAEAFRVSMTAASAAASAAASGSAGSEAVVLAQRVLSALPPALMCLRGVGTRADGPGSLGYSAADPAAVADIGRRVSALTSGAVPRAAVGTPAAPGLIGIIAVAFGASAQMSVASSTGRGNGGIGNVAVSAAAANDVAAGAGANARASTRSRPEASSVNNSWVRPTPAPPIVATRAARLSKRGIRISNAPVAEVTKLVNDRRSARGRSDAGAGADSNEDDDDADLNGVVGLAYGDDSDGGGTMLSGASARRHDAAAAAAASAAAATSDEDDDEKEDYEVSHASGAGAISSVAKLASTLGASTASALMKPTTSFDALLAAASHPTVTDSAGSSGAGSGGGSGSGGVARTSSASAGGRRGATGTSPSMATLPQLMTMQSFASAAGIGASSGLGGGLGSGLGASGGGGGGMSRLLISQNSYGSQQGVSVAGNGPSVGVVMGGGGGDLGLSFSPRTVPAGASPAIIARVAPAGGVSGASRMPSLELNVLASAAAAAPGVNVGGGVGDVVGGGVGNDLSSTSGLPPLARTISEVASEAAAASTALPLFGGLQRQFTMESSGGGR